MHKFLTNFLLISNIHKSMDKEMCLTCTITPVDKQHFFNARAAMKCKDFDYIASRLVYELPSFPICFFCHHPQKLCL